MNQVVQDSSETEYSKVLQHRADYIDLEDLPKETSATGKLFNQVTSELTNRGLRTITGPRGCGKTHMMRYAWLTCRDSKTKPFAVFASFQRYFRLEPFLSATANASQLFHSWVLARILISTAECCRSWSPKISAEQVLRSYGYPLNDLTTLTQKLERNRVIEGRWAQLSDALSIENTKAIIDTLRNESGRKFSVLLLDDAAMTLAPDYLIEFLDVVRSLKSTTIAPKVSVYPGTTEVSPRFHTGQDSVPISAWLSVDEEDYDFLMQDIAEVRIPRLNSVPEDVQALLRFAAFGIPRAYLAMLEDYLRGGFRTTQQGANKVVNEHLAARLAEFRTIAKKAPKLEILIYKGEELVNLMAKALKNYNVAQISSGRRGIVYGVRNDERTPLLLRTLNLLVEAGLIYYDGEVKHGTPERIYHKYIPHSALLLSLGVFNAPVGSGSIKHILQAVAYKPAKHPLRTSISSIAGQEFVEALDLALPKCSYCNERRLTDHQRFCHSCGKQLVEVSAFNACLDTPIAEVPGLTKFQRNQIASHLPYFKTLRDFLATQDPAADLLTVWGFGRQRTTRIIDVLNSYVDDFLS